MVAFEPISASIMGTMSIAQSLFGSSQESAQRLQQYKQSLKAVQRENELNARMVAAANKRTADIYGYQTGRFQQNLGFIQEDYARAGEDLQRELGSAFAQSAYSRQSQLAALSAAAGFNRAAFEGTSRSRQRADVLGTLGTFGRNAAMQAEQLAGVVGQTNRNRQALGRQATQSIFNAYGDLGILPELQQYTAAAMPDRPYRTNTGLTIMNALMGGASTAMSIGTSMASGGVATNPPKDGPINLPTNN